MNAGLGGPLQRLLWTVWALLCLWGGSAHAHESRPGYLALTETAAGHYSVLWKKPSGGEVELQMAPVFAAECRFAPSGQQQLTPGALLVTGQLSCSGGLAGKSLRIAGLESTITDVLVRVTHLDGRLETQVLRPSSPTLSFGASTSTAARWWGYTQLGVQHILLGADHLLFVLGLLLILRAPAPQARPPSPWRLVKTLSAFTVAHSITLALATLGWASVPAAPLNAAIALSILFLAPEIVRTWRGQTSLTIRHPWFVAFAFGLLHGFGFATGLTALGLPRAEVPIALLLFNLGVELGQLGFVALWLLMVQALRVLHVPYTQWPLAVQRLPAYAIGTLGAFWTLQRSLMLLGLTR